MAAYYTLAQLLARFRQDMDDVESPYLWSDPEAYEYLDQAQRDFARLTLIFSDKATVTVTAGNPEVSMPAGFIKLRRARTPDNREVKILTADQADSAWLRDDYGLPLMDSGWEDRLGPPRMLITDLVQDKLRASPYPDTGEADEVVTVWGYRMPATPVVDASSTLEVTDGDDQRALVLSMRAQAYSKHDSEGFDERLSAVYEDKFERYTSRRHRELARLRRPAGAVRYGGL